MAKTELVSDLRGRQNAASASPGAAPPAMALLDTTVVNPIIGLSMDQARVEVNDAFEAMQNFLNAEPDDIMRLASGHSARLSYIRVQIMRVEDWDRPWKNVRIREVEPAIEELREQWKNASRLQSVRELDWKMEAGER